MCSHYRHRVVFKKFEARQAFPVCTTEFAGQPTGQLRILFCPFSSKIADSIVDFVYRLSNFALLREPQTDRRGNLINHAFVKQTLKHLFAVTGQQVRLVCLPVVDIQTQRCLCFGSVVVNATYRFDHFQHRFAVLFRSGCCRFVQQFVTTSGELFPIFCCPYRIVSVGRQT